MSDMNQKLNGLISGKSLNFDGIRKIHNKRMTYEFDIPKNIDLEDLQYVLDDQWQRSLHFAFVDENSEESDLTIECAESGSKLSFVFILDECETVDEFIEKYNDLRREYSSPNLLDDRLCMANCGFHRFGDTGFCSKHKNLDATVYAKIHSDFIRKSLHDQILEMEIFIEKPLPKVYEYETSGENWEHNFILKLQ